MKFGATPKRAVIIDPGQANSIGMDLTGFLGNDSDGVIGNTW